MDIGTNELTRPFRIPRRRAGEKNAPDGVPDKTKRLHLGSQSDSRSPLASTSVRKSDSAFSSRIIPPTKKKISQDYQQTATNSRKSKPGELFDRIFDSMVNPPKERKKEPPQDDVEEAGPSGVTAVVSNSPPKRGTSGLTREDLERHQNDDTSCYAFMQREGLMERLLGHKMLTGRVDSHVVLGFLPFDPKDVPCRNRKNSSSKVDDFPTICEPPPVIAANEERRGPKTPPGSPGHGANSSVLSSRGVGSVSPSSPPPPPPVDENVVFSRESNKVKADEAPDLIAEMAELTKLPHNQLAECLGEELQKAMKQVDHKVLLETLKDALLKVGKKNDDHQDGQNHTAFKEDIHVYPVEMDLESNKSVSGNGVLLPPPPLAPLTPPSPNMVAALPVALSAAPVVMAPNVLPTPPPPPPLVMLHPGTASQVLASTSGTGAPSLYPYFPPPLPHQLAADQSVSPITVAGSQTSTAAGSVIFAGVPYTANLIANSPLSVPTAPSLNFPSNTSMASAQPSGMMGAFQNISVTIPHIATTPSASVAPYASQTPTFALYPGPSTQQLPSATTAFSAGNHHAPAVLAHNSQHSSTNKNVSNSDSLTVKLNNHPNVMVPPAVLHPYASATNYNITNTGTPFSVPATSNVPAIGGCTVTTTTTSTTTVSLFQQQQHQSKPLAASNTSFSCGPNFTESATYSTSNSHCNFSESRTSQNPYHSQYRTTNYSPPAQQHQKQSHQNPNFSGASSDGTAGTGTFGTQLQQLQPGEKSFCTNFSRQPSLQMQTSLESLPTSSNATFNGGETGSSRFLSSGPPKAESIPNDALIASGYSSDRSLAGRALNRTSANFINSKSSDEPVSVPSSQNVIKTLLSALSIPQSSDSAVTVSSGVAPNNSASVTEINDGDREVDFCWPPANMDSHWPHESGPSISEKTKKAIMHQTPSPCSQATNASRLMFFDQPIKAPSNSAKISSRTGASVSRPRAPILPPIQNRMPLNRLPRGPPGPIPALLSGGLRMRPPFRPSGLAACSPFPTMSVPPLRPRITPSFFARRQPFSLRPSPPGVRPPRPSFLR